MKTVFVNPERCIGCRQCEFACAVAHSGSLDATAALSEEPLPRARIHVVAGQAMHSSFPNRCRHCNPAPCEQACPTGAIARNTEHDVVSLDIHKCIACAMCAMVCPFDAVTFHAQANGMPARTVATKCDGCVDRLERDEEPACVEVCKVDALVFGELNELVAAGRVQESNSVLAAMAAQTPATPPPDSIAGWRAWGQAAAEVNEEA